MSEIIFDQGWIRARRILDVNAAILQPAIQRVLGQEARFFQAEIKKGFRTQSPAGGAKFKPLSPLTLAIRRFTGFGGTKALIVRGDLRNSVKAVQVGDGIFVGVLRSARGRNGKSLFNIAAVHEFGSGPIVIQVTKKMRGFLAMAFTAAFGGISRGGGGFSTGIIVTRIPPRPFIRPVFEKFANPRVLKRRFLWRLSTHLRQMGAIAPPARR